MKNPAVIDAYLGAHHDVDLGDSEGIKELAAELVADEESIVGTENAGIISLDVVASETDRPRSRTATVRRADGAAPRSRTAQRRTQNERHQRGSRRPARPDEDSVVKVTDLVAGYIPGVNILNGCSIEARKGELIGIIGPNGAGKSTLLKAMFGLVKVHSGSVVVRGQDITGLKANKLVSRGMGFVPQNNNVFAALTIEENLQMGMFQRPKDFAERFDFVTGLFPELGKRRAQRAGSLSGGERQMVAMGRALMMDPAVLLLDEPSAGLSPVKQDETFLRVHEINRAGVSVIMVEQNARRCLQICDRGYVLDQGKDAYTGTGRELMKDPKVIQLYLGTLADTVEYSPAAPQQQKGRHQPVAALLRARRVRSGLQPSPAAPGASAPLLGASGRLRSRLLGACAPSPRANHGAFTSVCLRRPQRLSHLPLPARTYDWSSHAARSALLLRQIDDGVTRRSLLAGSPRHGAGFPPSGSPMPPKRPLCVTPRPAPIAPPHTKDPRPRGGGLLVAREGRA